VRLEICESVRLESDLSLFVSVIYEPLNNVLRLNYKSYVVLFFSFLGFLTNVSST
jgi:hypothetical protein